MESYKKLFSFLENPKPAEFLLDKILRRLNEEEQLIKVKYRLMVFSLCTIFSAVLAVLSWSPVRTAFNQSGFTEFFSLLFSDFQIIVLNWKSFSLTLLESLPVMKLIIFLATVTIFLESLQLLVRNIKNFRYRYN